MRPNLLNVCQLFATIGVTIIVAFMALFLSLFNTMFTHLVFYITELHKIQVRSQLNFSKSLKQNEHVLLNKIWYYRLPKKSSQVVSEQILTLHFKYPSFSHSMLLQMSSDVLSVLSWACLRLGPCGSCI